MSMLPFDTHRRLERRPTPRPVDQRYPGVPFQPETWEPDADGDHPGLCTECGTPVMYGSRHGRCVGKDSR